ncbi:cleavage and polyadenylation specificity factor subunit 1 [Diaphorina citri]|uniref:Cleavage and polyadenylation specificity factor subunit 1 n=2 Tax=Diaphorina citri TaxID=121845 RepID=A0A3Q0JJT0_DIACI|nr:cleavage and polyadenylation specificity factor subunit 1 [Diaphorina citri]
MASNVADINDDELEVYGNQQATNVEITSYAFEVCDSLLNIGPCGNITMGEPAFLSEEFVNTAEPDIELVTTSGHGKNGALCILQRSIRPQIVTTFELPGCTNMWTVVGGASAGNKSEADTHAFLILSQDDSTMVLQTGREINELDSSGFTTHCPSVFAGNIGSNKYIVQVTAMAVHLLQEAELVQTVTLEVESVVVTATMADPYLVLLTQSGELVMLVYKETKQGIVFNGEDKELVNDTRDARFIPPLVSQFHVSLFSPFSWEEIPQTNFPLHEWEHVLCLKNVSMEYEGTLSGLRGYIALGTNYNYSEDVTCRGRILLFDIIEVSVHLC